MLPFMVASLTAASRLASTCRHSLARLRVVTKHACSGGGRGPGPQSCLSQILLGHHAALRGQAVGTVSSPAFGSHASFPLPSCWSSRVSASALATALKDRFLGQLRWGQQVAPLGPALGSSTVMGAGFV